MMPVDIDCVSALSLEASSPGELSVRRRYGCGPTRTFLKNIGWRGSVTAVGLNSSLVLACLVFAVAGPGIALGFRRGGIVLLSLVGVAAGVSGTVIFVTVDVGKWVSIREWWGGGQFEDLPGDGVIQGCLHLVVHLLGLSPVGLVVIVQLALVAGGCVVGIGHDEDVLMLAGERCGG